MILPVAPPSAKPPALFPSRHGTDTAAAPLCQNFVADLAKDSGITAVDAAASAIASSVVAAALPAAPAAAAVTLPTPRRRRRWRPGQEPEGEGRVNSASLKNVTTIESGEVDEEGDDGGRRSESRPGGVTFPDRAQKREKRGKGVDSALPSAGISRDLTRQRFVSVSFEELSEEAMASAMTAGIARGRTKNEMAHGEKDATVDGSSRMLGKEVERHYQEDDGDVFATNGHGVDVVDNGVLVGHPPDTANVNYSAVPRSAMVTIDSNTNKDHPDSSVIQNIRNENSKNTKQRSLNSDRSQLGHQPPQPSSLGGHGRGFKKMVSFHFLHRRRTRSNVETRRHRVGQPVFTPANKYHLDDFGAVYGYYHQPKPRRKRPPTRRVTLTEPRPPPPAEQRRKKPRRRFGSVVAPEPGVGGATAALDRRHSRGWDVIFDTANLAIGMEEEEVEALTKKKKKKKNPRKKYPLDHPSGIQAAAKTSQKDAARVQGAVDVALKGPAAAYWRPATAQNLAVGMEEGRGLRRGRRGVVGGVSSGDALEQRLRSKEAWMFRTLDLSESSSISMRPRGADNIANWNSSTLDH